MKSITCSFKIFLQPEQFTWRLGVGEPYKKLYAAWWLWFYAELDLSDDFPKNGTGGAFDI